jgi:hypothetical protein
VEVGRHGFSRSNVWNYPSANSFKGGGREELAWNPTTKPVALVADANVDVAIKRRQAWTKLEAVCAATGKTFEEIRPPPTFFHFLLSFRAGKQDDASIDVAQREADSVRTAKKSGCMRRRGAGFRQYSPPSRAMGAV